MALNARRVGRPGPQAAEDLQRHILEIARLQFVANGYAGTSLDQIAAEAGSGKQTLYRHFASKEGLFLAVMRSETARLNEIAAGAEANTHEPLEALRQCARLLFDFALDDGMISLSRILIAEAARFPDLGEFVFDTCLVPFKTRIVRLFHAAQETGAIIVSDDDLTFDLLRGLLLGTPVHRMLLGPNAFGEPAVRDVYFATAWRVFLRGLASPHKR
jgi:TetR/AcrR family transcriptional repressor of mexJK operon